MLLIFDNLQCADKSSLRLLQILTQDLSGSRLMIVATCPDVKLARNHPLSETLGELSHHPGFHRIHLRSLTRTEARQFVESTLGTGVSGDLVGTIYDRTDGNPLFVLEVARLLDQESTLRPDGSNTTGAWMTKIPEIIQAVISKRLNRLSENCNRLLVVASILGREFGIGELECVLAEQNAESILGALDEAFFASLIEEVEESMGRYRFSHALVQQGIASQLSAARRGKLHGQIGVALEEFYLSDMGDHSVELAHHFIESGEAFGEKRIHYLMEAGERALEAHAFEEAVEHLTRAMKVKEPQPFDPEMAAILVGLNQALMLSGRWKEGIPYLIRAFEYYVNCGDVARAVDAVDLSFAPALGLFSPAEDASLNELRERALKLVDRNSHEAARLYCQCGLFQYYRSDYNTAAGLLGHALNIAKRENDTVLEARILAGSAMLDLKHLCIESFIEKSSRAIELARAAQDGFTERSMSHLAGFNLIGVGELDRAQAYADAMHESGERLRSRKWSSQSFHLRQAICQFTGKWRLARDYVNLDLFSNPSDVFSLHNLALLEHESGSYAESDNCLDQIIKNVKKNTPLAADAYSAIACVVISLLAEVSDAENRRRLEFAESAAGNILASPYIDPFMAWQAKISLCVIAMKRGDIKMLGQHNGVEIAKMSDFVSPWGNMSMNRLLGSFACALSNNAVATTHFENSISFCRKSGYRPELARTYYDAAGLLMTHDGATDQRKAILYLHEGMAIARKLDMNHLKKLIGERLAGVGALPYMVDRSLSPLTDRELQVLRLVADGKTNREIACDLFISEFTVGNHVGNILRKTNSTNRTEAARRAIRLRLIED